MMKGRIRICALVLGGATALALAGCGGGANATLLQAAAESTPLSYNEYRGEDISAVRGAANAFSATFSAEMAERNAQAGENYILSPVSVYTGLSLAAACAAGRTKTQLLSALGVSEAQLDAGFSPFYRSLVRNIKDDRGKERTVLQLANAVYVANDVPMSEVGLQKLASDYFCYSYQADFLGDNSGANNAVRNFVKEQTHGLIDQNFALSPDTLFALINALYLKDVWNAAGMDLPTHGTFPFAGYAGSANVPYLRGAYTLGRAYDGDGYTLFLAHTYGGYKVKFLLPDAGVSAQEVFTAQHLAAANAVTDFSPHDHEAKIHYHTRCIFPAFSGGSDGSARATLQEVFGVNDLFDASASDLSAVTHAERAFLSDVRHVATLTVDERGIEGAAVTILPGASDAGPDGYENVYLDFMVERAFAFLLTDAHDTVLFSGIVDRV